MPVQTISLFDTVTDSADAPVANATVTLTFGYNSATTADGLLQPSQRTVQTDGTGKFTFAKVIPVDLISPANTVFVIETPFRVYEVAPQSGNGASQQSTAANVIVNNPLALAPYTLIGPVSVTGTLAVTGALTVASNTGMQVDALGNISGRSLSLSSIGPYTPSALAGGADYNNAVRMGGGDPYFDLTAPPFNARGDGRLVFDAAITGGQAVVTSPGNNLVVGNATFTGLVPLSAGMKVAIVGAGAAGATLVGTVLASPAPTAGSVTINVNAGTGVSGATAWVGTDDTAAVQAWMNKCSNNSVSLFAPAALGFYGQNTFLLSATISVPFANSNKVSGGAFQATQFLMMTDNIPIFKTVRSDMYGWFWDQIQFAYAAPQGAANTNAIAFMLSKGVGSNAGWFHWKIGRLMFVNTYEGFAFDPTTVGAITVWDWDGDFLWFKNTQHSAIRFTPSSSAIGMPTNTLRHISILNTGSGITTDGPAIQTDFCQLQIDSLDIEDWSNHLLDFGPAAGDYVGVEIRQLHVERHRFLTANDWAIRGSAGTLKISMWDMESSANSSGVLTGLAIGAGNFAYLVQIPANGRLELKQFVSDMFVPVSGNFQLIKAAAGAKVWLRDIKDIFASLAGGNPAPAADAVSLATIQQEDGPLFRNGVFVGNGAPALPTGAVAGVSSDGFNLYVQGVTNGLLYLRPNQNANGQVTIDGATFRMILSGQLARLKQTPTEAVLVSGVTTGLGEEVVVTLTAARLVGAPLAPVTGDHLIFTLIQGGAGGFAVTWNAVFKVSWADTNNTTGKRSSIEFQYDGTNWNQVAAQAPYV